MPRNFDPAWQERFAAKIRTADEAVAGIRDGQHVFVGSGAAVPQTLVEALARRTDLSDVEVSHILTLSAAPYAAPELGQSFRHNAYFIGANVRQAVAQARADHTSIFLNDIPRLFRSGRKRIDVALISVSPPDEHGFCTYGVACDVVKSATESARVVVAEVNEMMPRMLGDAFIHSNNIDVMLPSERPIIEAPQGRPDELSRQIGAHICTLIEDGCTMQLGIGGIPDGVLFYLDQFRDLGVHSEMFSDGVISLVEKGAITNARKSLNPGKMVCSFVMGSRKLYDFVDNNLLVDCRPTEYTNDPFIVAQNDKMVAINAALEIDLTGQVCADSLGTTFFSGFGGQVDFIRGAARSRGGRPIIALPSTAQDGQCSRIVPMLKPGAGVVTGRADVHYVVTEFGVAYLHGKTARERALALIQIAHPDFREQLVEDARQRHLLPRNQISVSTGRLGYDESLERRVTLRDESTAFLRPIRLTDEAKLRDLLYRLSPQLQYDPFFQLHFSSASARLQAFLQHHYEADRTLMVLAGPADDAELFGIGHYKRVNGSPQADAAIFVRDDWRRLGVGWEILSALIESATAAGVEEFITVLPTDSAPRMLRALQSQGYGPVVESSDENVRLRIPFSREVPAATG